MIRVRHAYGDLDLYPEVAARLGLSEGDHIDAMRTADAIHAQADERFERKRWAPAVVPARRVPLAALWLLLVFGVSVVLAGWVL